MSHISTSNKTPNWDTKNRVNITTADEAVSATDEVDLLGLDNPQDAIEMKPISTSTDEAEEAP